MTLHRRPLGSISIRTFDRSVSVQYNRNIGTQITFLKRFHSYGSVLVPGKRIFKSYVGDSNSYVGDNKSYVGHSNSYVGDNKSHVGDSNSLKHYDENIAILGNVCLVQPC